jgi:hypothetical protein
MFWKKKKKNKDVNKLDHGIECFASYLDLVIEKHQKRYPVEYNIITNSHLFYKQLEKIKVKFEENIYNHKNI